MRLGVLVAASLLVVAGCDGAGEDDLGAPERTDAGASTRPDDGAAPGPEAGPPPTTKHDAGTAPVGPEESGEATHYDPTGTSSCGFKGNASSLVAAMNSTQYRKADCGKCVEVTGPKGKTIVPVVDRCPGCERGDLDLSTNAFAKIANLSAGRVKITWHFVACP